MILGALWGVRYLVEMKGLNSHNAHLSCSLLFIGMIVGSPFFGWISDILKNRKKPITFGILGSILIILAIMSDNYQTSFLMPILFFLLGLIHLRNTGSQYLCLDNNSKHLLNYHLI